jgi:hypothetical protein
MHPNTKWFLADVKYCKEKREIAVIFLKNTLRKTLRFSFFPKAFISNELHEKAKSLLSGSFAKKIFLKEPEQSTEVRAATFPDLKEFLFLVEKNEPLIEPERQFLLEMNWSYFDEFDFLENEPVQTGFGQFPKINRDGVCSLEDGIHSLLDSDEKEAFSLLKKIACANILKKNISTIPEEQFALNELFLQNLFFKNRFSLLSSKKNTFPSAKGLFENNCKDLWAIFSLPFFNFGFETLNCNCCAPSLKEPNLLPNSLVETTFLSDGAMVCSSLPLFAREFHANSCGKNARKMFKLKWGLNVPPVGPFSRGTKILLPVNDALRLEKEKLAVINLNNSFLKWFCMKQKSFLSKELESVNNLLIKTSKKMDANRSLLLQKNGLAYTLLEKNSVEHNFFETTRTVLKDFLETIPLHLLSPFSRFYDSGLSEAIESVHETILLNTTAPAKAHTPVLSCNSHLHVSKA